MTTTATGTEQSTGPLGEAASAFEQLLTLDDGDTQGIEAKANESDTDEVEDEGAKASEDEADEAEAEDGESDEAEDDAPQSKDQTFTVRVDGKEEQVPLSELLAGYSRTKDYTQKTQALATQRKTLEQAAAAAAEERAEYAALLPRLRAVLEADLQEPNWEQLRATDPVRAAVEKDRFEERKAKIAALRAEEERVNQRSAQEMEAQRNQILIEQRELMLQRPELAHWRDSAKASEDTALIVEMLKDAGYADDEMQIYDHRAMVIALKAARYDQLVKKRGASQQAIQQKATKAPVAKPGNGGQQAPSAIRKAGERLSKSGSIKDAAAFFETILP